MPRPAMSIRVLIADDEPTLLRMVAELIRAFDGFEVAALSAPDEKGRGFGLLGIRERVELLGGTVRIESSPGCGTLVALDVPVGMEAAA